MGNQYDGCGFSTFLEKCTECVVNLGPTLPASFWAGEVFLAIPCTSPSRPTPLYDVHKFIALSVFYPSLIYYDHFFNA